ncbi:hypothetical protein GCG21_13640 [Pseudactinotalea sp. HY160]|uniref:hypothetical protein n=1 Tax=Pseudactinotalea sp. HY160 TaxID=2654490 RepID=UPI00128D2E7E|nr:hypothetical protein [Pseudactinotalea sp. HY160]MPV51029.1 hypothetical protein [Pseudactinotalea sp. HY160]
MTTTSNRARQPAGTPDGGQFAQETRPDGGLRLSEPSEWVEEDTGDDNHVRQVRRIESNPAFNARVRLLLGVSDPDAPVSVVEEEESFNPWGCDTWESSSSIEVSAGGVSRTFGTLPDLLARLEAADRPPITARAILDDLGRDAEWTIQVSGDSPIRLRGRIGNADGGTVVIVTGDRTTAYNWIRGMHSDTGDGGTLLRVSIADVISYDVDRTQARCMHCDVTVTDTVGIETQRCDPCTDERRCRTCGEYFILIGKLGYTECTTCQYGQG